MKYKTLFVISCTFLLATSCGEEVKIPKEVSLSVVDIASTVSIHTAAQKEFLTIEDPNDYVVNHLSSLGKESIDSPLAVSFCWSETNELNQPASSYKVTISEFSDLSNPLVYTAKTTKLDVYNLKINVDYYYQVSSNHSGTYFDSEIKTFKINETAPRNLYVDGVENVRDLGGWNIGENIIYKQGLIYRTAQFNYGGNDNTYVSAPTKEGKNTLLNELKIKTEIDLRRTKSFDGKDEVNGITSSPLGSGVKYVSAPMYYGNKNIFTNSDNKKSIQLFFSTLADASNYPIAFHCLRGTDRTGALAYLLGALVGMNEKDLLRDYLFSDFAKIGDPVTNYYLNQDDFYVKGIASSDGDTLSDKAMSYLYNTCQIEKSTLESIIDILTD